MPHYTVVIWGLCGVVPHPRKIFCSKVLFFTDFTEPIAYRFVLEVILRVRKSNFNVTDRRTCGQTDRLYIALRQLSSDLKCHSPICAKNISVNLYLQAVSVHHSRALQSRRTDLCSIFGTLLILSFSLDDKVDCHTHKQNHGL